MYQANIDGTISFFGDDGILSSIGIIDNNISFVQMVDFVRGDMSGFLFKKARLLSSYCSLISEPSDDPITVNDHIHHMVRSRWSSHASRKLRETRRAVEVMLNTDFRETIGLIDAEEWRYKLNDTDRDLFRFEDDDKDWLAYLALRLIQSHKPKEPMF